MKLEYRFPIVYFYGDDPEDNEIRYCTGTITPVSKDRNFLEAVVEAQGTKFHVISGSYQRGWFICIPALMYGCELNDPMDTLCNIESMTKRTTELCYEDATAIAYGIAAMQGQIE